MSQQAAEANTPEDTSYLGMSDDAFMEMDPSEFESTEPAEDALPEEEDADLDVVDDESVDADEPTDDVESESEDAGASAEADDEDEPEETSTEDTDLDADEDADEDGDQETDEETDTDTEADVDYKAEYERLLAPFRANGKEMQVKSVDEAVQLMQMGAGFNKKMAGLKPAFKTLKLLEKNNLLDETKLSYLIDLDRKDPEAIRKLVKDSGIDPMEMDVDADSDYKPNTYTVDDRELELDEVLESIADSPTYPETIKVVSNKWDTASKQIIANNPQLLTVLNDHMASGIYKTVSDAVERERSFGRLKGLSDIEAYKQMGDQLDADGKLKAEKPARATAPKTVAPKRKANDPKLKSKKRAASSTKAKPTAKEPDFNPLSMSDAEFEKQFNESLL